MTGLVKVNPTVIPTRRVLSRETRSSSNKNVPLFVPKKCKTSTYQRSFFIRTARIWNALADDIGLSVTISLSLFKAHLLSYYKQSLYKSYDPEDPRSFRSVCTSCNKARNLIRNIDCCVFRAHSNWHKLLWCPCLYCIIYIFISTCVLI